MSNRRKKAIKCALGFNTLVFSVCTFLANLQEFDSFNMGITKYTDRCEINEGYSQEAGKLRCEQYEVMNSFIESQIAICVILSKLIIFSCTMTHHILSIFFVLWVWNRLAVLIVYFYLLNIWHQIHVFEGHIQRSFSSLMEEKGPMWAIIAITVTVIEIYLLLIL